MKNLKQLSKLLVLVSLITVLKTHSQTVNTEWATKINQTFVGIDKNKVPHSLLKDYAMEFIDLAAYNGILTDTSYVSKGTLTTIYNTLLMARVKTTVPGLISPTLYKQNWNNLRQKNTIVLSGLYYKYSQFKSNATPNFLTITNNKLYDKYVNGVWQNPYEEKRVFAISPPIVKYKGLKTTVKLPSSLWYTNQSSSVQSITIDFDNGAGYVSMPFNGNYVLQYTQEGIKTWKFKMILTNGQVLYSQSRMIFEKTLYDTTTTTLFRTINQPCSQNQFGIDQVEFSGTQFYLGLRNTATLEIDYADDDCLIKKPLIVAEGFDSGLLGAENGLGDNDYDDFLTEATFLTGNLAGAITDYDIIYVNWDKGRDHLQRNALLLEDIILWVNQQKAIANSTEKNVVLGQSMGGVIARYALADMEQRPVPLIHDTKLYISHDAPHQGANIPVGIQYFARHLADQFIGTPMGDYSFEVSDGNSASIAEINALFNAPGTQQLLTSYIKGNFQLDTNSMNDAWQAELLQKGYPTKTRNIAISNGSHCANTQEYDYNASLFKMSGNIKTGVLADMLGSFLGMTDEIVLAVVFNEPALLLGFLPGSSKFNLDFNARALPIANQSANIYKGKISYTKKWFNVITITVNLTNRSFDYNGNFSFDKYAGGRYELFGDVNGIGIFDDNGNLTQFQADLLNALVGSANIDFDVEQTFGFITTPSALDVGGGNVVLNDNDYYRIYSATDPPTGNRAIPFHNFITAFENANSLNERHISFNVRNGNWLATELDTNPSNNAVFNCSFMCEGTEISGPEIICTSQIFAVPAGGVSYTWSVSGSVASIAPNGNTATITRIGQNNGSVTITVVINGGDCGNVTLTKQVWVGIPMFNSFIPIGNQTGFDPTDENISTYSGNIACNQISMKVLFDADTILEYQWEKFTTDVNWNVNSNSGNLNIVPLCNKDFSFRVRARNSCGWSAWKDLEFYMSRCNVDCEVAPVTGTLTGNNFILSPNPVSSGTLSIVIKSTSPWFYPPQTIDPVTGMPNPPIMVIPRVNITIYSQSGTLMQSYTNKLLPAQLDISTFAQGVYMVIFEKNGQTESFNIIKS